MNNPSGVSILQLQMQYWCNLNFTARQSICRRWTLKFFSQDDITTSWCRNQSSQAQLRMMSYWWGTAGPESPDLTWCILSRSSWERSKRCRRESRSTSSAPPLCGSRHTRHRTDKQHHVRITLKTSFFVTPTHMSIKLMLWPISCISQNLCCW